MRFLHEGALFRHNEVERSAASIAPKTLGGVDAFTRDTDEGALLFAFINGGNAVLLIRRRILTMQQSNVAEMRSASEREGSSGEARKEAGGGGLVSKSRPCTID